MYSVILSGLRFQTPIGLYPEEQILGNEIEIDITLSRDSPLSSPPLLDYEKVYTLISREAGQNETLLENLMERIIDNLKSTFPNTEITIEIRKRHPPFGGSANYAAVRWSSFKKD